MYAGLPTPRPTTSRVRSCQGRLEPVARHKSGRSDPLAFAVITTVAYALLGAGAGRVGERLLGRTGFARWLNRATGVLFIAPVLRLLLTERK